MGRNGKTRQRVTSNADLLKVLLEQGQNDFSGSSYHQVKGDIARALISDAAARAGCDLSALRGMFYVVGNARTEEVIWQNAPAVSVVSSAITVNKHLTKRVLARFGYPVPVGAVFRDEEVAFRYANGRNGPVVVKPLRGSGGAGVSVGVEGRQAFRAAWAGAFRRGGSVVVEDYHQGDELRVIVVEGKAQAAVWRVPAHVIGDGVSSVAELIEKKNELRRLNPLLKLYPVPLPLDGASVVPASGEFYYLNRVSNVALGGDSVSVIDYVHPSILRMAEKASREILGARMLGFDILVNNITSPAADNNCIIIEINSNPAIGTPYFAAYGRPAGSLPDSIVASVIQFGARLKERATNCSAVVPAPLYEARCGGTSFRRNYSTQMRLLRQAAYTRNLKVTPVSPELTYIESGKTRVGFFQGMCSLTRLVARRASNDKNWTKVLLEKAGVNTPSGELFDADFGADAAWGVAGSWACACVVKPISGSGGKGVSTEIESKEHFHAAWDNAIASGAKRILVEQYVEGRDYRVFVVGRNVAAVTRRIPAHLIGDGVSDIKDLVEQQNRLRLGNPHFGAKKIELTPMIMRNLHSIGLSADSVLEAGRRLQLHSVANIGSGGTSLDCTGEVHPGWAVVAGKVSEALFSPTHLGFDLIAQDIARSPDEQVWSVIEVNLNPDFGLQHFPGEGAPRDVAGAVLDHLFAPAKRVKAVQARFEIKGVQVGDALTSDIWRTAHLCVLDGYLKCGRGDSIELVVRGTSSAVERMAEACREWCDRYESAKFKRTLFVGNVSRGFVSFGLESGA